MTLDELTTYVSDLLDFAMLTPDTELFDSTLVDSLALIEIVAAFNLDLDTFTRESWGTCRKLYEVMINEAS